MKKHGTIGLMEDGNIFCAHLYAGDDAEKVMLQLKKYSDKRQILSLLAKGRIIELESTHTKDSDEYITYRVPPSAGNVSTFYENQPFGSIHLWKDVQPFFLTEPQLSQTYLADWDDCESLYYYIFDVAKGEWSCRRFDDKPTPLPSRDIQEEVSIYLSSVFRKINIDRPHNFDEIVSLIIEDVQTSADSKDYHDGDFAIAFRRLLERGVSDL